MKKLLDISSEERNRILEMHQSATKRNYLSEQNPPSGQPANTQTEGIDINGAKYKLTNVVKDAASLAKFLDYNPDENMIRAFCRSTNAQCSGGGNRGENPPSLFASTKGGKPSYWAMMREYAKMYLNEVAKQYGNKIIPTACSDSPGYVVYYENLEPIVMPAFKQKYGLDDRTYDEFNKYFGTVAKYKTGLQSALKTQLNKLGACAAKPNPEQRSFTGQG
jgi:hypothetical protein